MKRIIAECVYPAGAVLGEGPFWDKDRDRLWWVDIERREIHAFDPATLKDRAWTLPDRVGFAIPSMQGDLIVGTEHGVARFDPGTGALTPKVHPEAALPGNRFNDAKCDPSGRLWAGTMACDERPECGRLYRIDSHWHVTPMVDRISISNGLAWSPEGRTMYYIDSPTRCVDAFDFHDGEISGRRTVIKVTDGFPDGMCIDAQGNLWIALWGGWGVGCYDPRTGECLARVEIPVEAVTSCCFGRNDELFITCASRDLDAAGRKNQPLAGGLFCASVGVTAPAGEPQRFREL